MPCYCLLRDNVEELLRNLFFPNFIWWNMGSRRTMTRSLSGNERSLNGTEMSGSSRSPGCSYLSNVRPENRYIIPNNTTSQFHHAAQHFSKAFQTYYVAAILFLCLLPWSHKVLIKNSMSVMQCPHQAKYQ